MAISLILGALILVAAEPAESQTGAQPPAQSLAPASTQPEAQPQAPTHGQPAAEAKKEEFPLHPVERAIVAQTNHQRARHGLPPLEVDPGLVASARMHAAWMSRNRTLQHTSRPVAENIAMGQTTCRQAVADWMSSSGHRANILSRGHRRIGVAAYCTPNGTIYWCQQFRP